MSPYDYWQFWRNLEDADVSRFLKLFTDIPLDEIDVLARAEGADLNAVKERLAFEITALTHGRKAAQQAAATARQAFARGEAVDGLPTVGLLRDELLEGAKLVDVLVRAGFASSKGDARRMIEGRGVRLNSEVVADIDARVMAAALPTRLSVGRKRHAVVR